MVFSLDFLGFGSKRKWAFGLLEREWAALDIDIRRVDGGVKQLLFQWAQEFGDSKDEIDPYLMDLAAWSGFLMLGPELGARPFGPDGVKTMEKRLSETMDLAARTDEEADDPLDVRVVKLVLAAKLADRDIEALITLDEDAKD